ncbi:MAG: hypothetical protein P8129_06085 [Anaerolineae bacterium]
MSRWIVLAGVGLLFALLLTGCGATTIPAPADTPLPTASIAASGPVAQRSTPSAERPTDEEIADWMVPPEGWREHVSERWAVSFYVPGDWQAAGPDHLAGDDGFARLAPFEGPGASVDQACEWLANYRRDLYGPAPGILSVPHDNSVYVDYYPCLIVGGAEDGGDGAGYGAAIVLANPAPVGKQEPAVLLLDVDPAHALTIAYSLTYLRQAPPAPTLSASSFGRELAPEEVPDELPLRVKTFGDLTLEEHRIIDAGVDAPGHFEFVQRIPESVLDARHNMALGHAAVFPLYYLGSWDGRWVVEANGMLIVDGAVVNQELGYEEVFGCQELNGQPFYFFVEGGKTYLSYGGETLPLAYDDVFHGRCCEPAAFNTAGNEHMVWFYALRDGFWHYVELGAYDD